MEKRHTVRVAVYLILIKDNKILLQRRANTGWMDRKYTTAASGHLEVGETVIDAMIREAYEECRIKLNPQDLDVVLTVHRRSDFDYVDFFVKARKWEGNGEIGEKDKIDDIQWFPINKLPTNTIHYIKRAIEDYQKGITFTEFGWE